MRPIFEVIVQHLFSLTIAVIGLYQLLAARGAGARGETQGRRMQSRRATGLALTITGLIAIVALNSQPTSEWRDSVAGSPAQTILFQLGSLLAIGGSAGLVATSIQSSLRIALTTFLVGVSMLFAAGNSHVPAVVALIGAGVCGWQSLRSPAPGCDAADADEVDRTGSAREPLLLSVLIVGLGSMLGAAIHESATVESRPAGRVLEQAQQNARRMPPPRVIVDQPASHGRNSSSKGSTDANGPASPSASAASGSDRISARGSRTSVVVLTTGVAVVGLLIAMAWRPPSIDAAAERISGAAESDCRGLNGNA